MHKKWKSLFIARFINKGEKEVLSETNEFFSSIVDEEKIVAISGLSSDNDAK